MADIADIADELVTAEIEASIGRRVRYQGVSATECEDCGEVIPERRRELLPGVRLCVDCQGLLERASY